MCLVGGGVVWVLGSIALVLLYIKMPEMHDFNEMLLLLVNDNVIYVLKLQIK